MNTYARKTIHMGMMTVGLDITAPIKVVPDWEPFSMDMKVIIVQTTEPWCPLHTNHYFDIDITRNSIMLHKRLLKRRINLRRIMQACTKADEYLLREYYGEVM